MQDNGGPVATRSNWPMRGGKHTIFDGGLKVPAFILSNKIAKPGSYTRLIL